MAVADPPWWGVWWPWLLVWGITAASLIAAVIITVSHWRNRHNCLHLTDAEARKLTLQYIDKHKGALHKRRDGPPRRTSRPS